MTIAHIHLYRKPQLNQVFNDQLSRINEHIADCFAVNK